MSIPSKHHYLPQFYLERWVNEAGVLFEYSRPHREIVIRKRLPVETGFKEELYSIKGRLDPQLREEVEIKFMQRLDCEASCALAEIERLRAKPTEGSSVTAWSRFVMSLVYRNPARVEDLRARVEQIERDPRIQAAYEAVRSECDPENYDDFVGREGASLNEEAQAHLIRKVIDSKFVGQRLNNIPWVIADIPKHTHDLILSDSPVVTSNGIGVPGGFLILPIGPRTFFLATHDLSVQRYLLAENESGRVSNALNNAVVRNAEVLVIASCEHHRRFVEKRLVMPQEPRRERLTWQLP